MKFLCCCFVLLSNISFACLNEHHVNKAGKSAEGAFFIEDVSFHKRHNTVELETYLKNLRQEKTTDAQDAFENDNSIAVALIKLGHLEEAETILNKLYKQQPNDYSVNANLGTLYELQGKNEKALEFIRKSMRINPDSHNGSEWFHVKILEFKLKNIPEDKIASTDILGLGTKKKDHSLIANQIKYQLQERIPFMPAPNMLVAKILDEYAGYLADNVSISGAYIMYSIGQEYDPKNILQFTQKKEALKPYFKKYKQEFPKLKNYYFDPVAPNNNNEKAAEVASAVLDKGIKSLEVIQQQEKDKKQKNIWLWGSGIALVGGAAVYRLRKRKSNV